MNEGIFYVFFGKLRLSNGLLCILWLIILLKLN